MLLTETRTAGSAPMTVRKAGLSTFTVKVEGGDNIQGTRYWAIENRAVRAGPDAVDRTNYRKGLPRLPMTVDSRVPGFPVGFILISRDVVVKVETMD